MTRSLVNKSILALSLVLACLFSLIFYSNAYAVTYTVKYVGGAENFISDENNLFSHFDQLMPGDTVNGELELHNGSPNEVSVYFFTEEGEKNRESADDLFDKISLLIKNGDKVIYDGTLRGAELKDAVLLGNLNPGDHHELFYEISVPTDLNNEYELAENEVIWNFQVQEVEKPGTIGQHKSNSNLSQTGDNLIYIIGFILIVAALSVFALIIAKRRSDEEKIVESSEVEREE